MQFPLAYQSEKPMLITVITVCFNSARTIGRTIETLRSQTYCDFEHIVIDGGSTDDTIEIVSASPSDRFTQTIISEPDNGIYDAMNKGIRLAKGEIIAFLNSDDWYGSPDLLNRVASFFESDISADNDMIGGRVIQIDRDTGVWKRVIDTSLFQSWQLYCGNMPPHPAIFVRKSVFSDVGHFNTKLKVAADFDFFVRSLLLKQMRISSLDGITTYMSAGGVSSAGYKSNLLITREMFWSLRANDLPAFRVLLWLRFPAKILIQVAPLWINNLAKRVVN